MHTIRRLNPGEGFLYREVRLEALKDSPEAFSTSYESAQERDDQSWATQADASAEGGDRATFLVIADRVIGMAALYRDADVMKSGELVQMWIAPDYRGTSVSMDLLDHLFRWASQHGFETIHAGVTPGNLRALRFYEKYGFSRINSEEGDIRLEKACAVIPPMVESRDSLK